MIVNYNEPTRELVIKILIPVKSDEDRTLFTIHDRNQRQTFLLHVEPLDVVNQQVP